jgi:very-short-patch-repair endonuclease
MREPQPTKFARTLRRNESDAERKLWSKLRSRQFQNLKFRRQQPLGKYIVDFVSFEKKIIIEVDGSQHDRPGNIEHDAQRTRYFENEGYIVLRFWNNDVLTNIEGVGLKILEQIDTMPKLYF